MWCCGACWVELCCVVLSLLVMRCRCVVVGVGVHVAFVWLCVVLCCGVLCCVMLVFCCGCDACCGFVLSWLELR